MKRASRLWTRSLFCATVIGAVPLIGACSSVPEPKVRVADVSAIQNRIRQEGQPLLMVHVWATWCPPCVEEFPVLLQIAQRYTQDVELLLISADDPEKPEGVTSFLQRYGSSYGSLIAANLNQAFIETLSPEWAGALPATFFYRKGELIAEHTGAMTAPQYETMINALLK